MGFKPRLAVFSYNNDISILLNDIGKYEVEQIQTYEEVNLISIKYDLCIINHNNLNEFLEDFNPVLLRFIIFIHDSNLFKQSLDTNFLIKPFKFQHLVELIDSLFNENLKEYIIDEKYSFSFLKKTLFKKNNDIVEEISLTEKEALLIDYLLKNNQFITKENILKNIWNYHNIFDTHTLETHIYRLRQKLGSDNNLIITNGEGYKLNFIS